MLCCVLDGNHHLETVIVTMSDYEQQQLKDDLAAYLARFMRDVIVPRPRGQQVKLPARVCAPVWPSIIKILHSRFAGRLELQSEDQIEHLMGDKMKMILDPKRTKSDYALIKPPLVVEFDLKKGNLIAYLHYAIFNPSGVKQFPNPFDLKKTLPTKTQAKKNRTTHGSWWQCI